MKTALKELEIFIENQIYNYLDSKQLNFANLIQQKVRDLQEIEKNHILEAFDNGINCGVENEFSLSDVHARNYYEKNFKK